MRRISNAFRPFCLTICILVLFNSTVAYSVVVDSTLQSMRPQSSNDIQTRPKGLLNFKMGASAGWGLWMESEMEFLDEGKVVNTGSLKLGWENVGGEFYPVVTKSDEKKRVIFESFSEESSLRLALWVSRSQSSIPFSAPPIDHPAHKELTSFGYVNPTNIFSVLSVDRNYDREKGEYVVEAKMVEVSRSLLDRVLVHPVLNTKELVEFMGYIDFSDSRIIGPTSEYVVIKHPDSESIVNKLSAANSASGSGESYTNADIDAEFSYEFSTGTTSGTPLRYYWSHDVSGNIKFHLVTNFVESADVENDLSEGYRAKQAGAIELYRLASVFSSFAENNKESFFGFIDEAFKRAEAE